MNAERMDEKGMKTVVRAEAAKQWRRALVDRWQVHILYHLQHVCVTMCVHQRFLAGAQAIWHNLMDANGVLKHVRIHTQKTSMYVCICA